MSQPTNGFNHKVDKKLHAKILFTLYFTVCEVPPCTLRRALTSYLDISSTPTRDIIREWIQYAEDDADAEELEKLSSDLPTYKNWKQKYPNVSTLMVEYPSLKVPAACLVGTLHKLKPRAYSVASIDPQFTFFGIKNIPVTDLMVEMVEYKTGFKADSQSNQFITRKGVCTSFLDRLPIGGKFLSYHHANAVFRMPHDSNASILMISAGSGIGKYQSDIYCWQSRNYKCHNFSAPFRAFWQQRVLLDMPKSRAWLYYGCRNVSENVFDDETRNIVHRHTAMSRIDGKEKEYVQHLLERDQSFVYDFIAFRKGFIYICGSVSCFVFLINVLMIIVYGLPKIVLHSFQIAMALDVKATLAQILVKIGGETIEMANESIYQLQRNGRLMEEYFG